MYNIGFDLGSSSIKGSIVDSNSGKELITLNEPKKEMNIISSQNDWAEQSPNKWWEYICNLTKRLINESKIKSEDISNVGISYQMHGLVVVDRDGNPLRNSIIWCDSRAVEIGEIALEQLGSKKCSENLLNSPGNFTASKLKWVKENEPDIYKKIYKYMLPGDYIAYKLTGIISTTRNGLSEGILWDYKNFKIANWLLDYYGIDPSLTPNLVENFTDQGRITSEASSLTGLPEGIPISYRAGDQPNNALSLNVFKVGEIAATAGTSGVVYAITDNIISKELTKINHFAHVNYTRDNQVLGKLLCINSAGIMYKWLKNISKEDSYKSMNEKANQIKIGSEGLVIIPFGNGAERMFNNMNLGGHFFNLNLNKHTNHHIYRAALESIAFSFVYGIEILKNDHTKINVIKAGNDNLFRSEIFSTTVSTLIDQKIEIYNTTGSIGAARAAGLIDGDFNKFEKNITSNDHVKTFSPNQDKKAYIRAYENWKIELNKILNK